MNVLHKGILTVTTMVLTASLLLIPGQGIADSHSTGDVESNTKQDAGLAISGINQGSVPLPPPGPFQLNRTKEPTTSESPQSSQVTKPSPSAPEVPQFTVETPVSNGQAPKKPPVPDFKANKPALGVKHPEKPENVKPVQAADKTKEPVFERSEPSIPMSMTATPKAPEINKEAPVQPKADPVEIAPPVEPKAQSIISMPPTKPKAESVLIAPPSLGGIKPAKSRSPQMPGFEKNPPVAVPPVPRDMPAKPMAPKERVPRYARPPQPQGMPPSMMNNRRQYIYVPMPLYRPLNNYPMPPSLPRGYYPVYPKNRMQSQPAQIERPYLFPSPSQNQGRIK